MKINNIKNSQIFTVLVLLFIVCCSENDSNNNQKMEMTRKGKVQKLYSLEPFGKVLFLEDEKNMIGEIRSFKVSENGSFYFLDSRLSRISVYSSKGEYMRSFEKKGNAPDEFNRLTKFDIKEDLTVCWDFFAHKFVIYDTLGRYINYFRPDLNDKLGGYDVCFGEEKSILFLGVTIPKKKKAAVSSCNIESYSIKGDKFDLQTSLFNEIINENDIDLMKYEVGEGMIIRAPKSGKIYFCMSGIPIVLEFDRNLKLIRKIKVSTPITMLRIYHPDDDQRVRPLHSEIYSLHVQEENNLLFLLQLVLTPRSDDPRDQERAFYLSAFDLSYDEPKLVLSDIRIPMNREIQMFKMWLDVGLDGVLYIYEDDRPEHNIIGKYRLKIITES